MLSDQDRAAADVEMLTKVFHKGCELSHQPDHGVPPCRRLARRAVDAGYGKAESVLREGIATDIEALKAPAAPEFARGFGLARSQAAAIARKVDDRC